jgi:hypothetical protein
MMRFDVLANFELTPRSRAGENRPQALKGGKF